jgi:DNA (cytosine-5)-methyltransferase 1
VTFRFVDLFCGIGGFHAAMSALGGECVYAVDIDEAAASVYRRNWGLDPLGDITADANDEHVGVPDHEVLCAGFPCQPFSKSGAQRGMDETRGTLYWNILRIIESRRPALVLLENVRNLAGPRHRHEWDLIIRTLREAGYIVSDAPAIFSPHLLPPSRGGKPHVRERVFIAAVRASQPAQVSQAFLSPVVSPRPVGDWDPQKWNLEKDLPLDTISSDATSVALSDREIYWIDAWDEFVRGMWDLREGRRLPGFPLWGDDWVPESEVDIDADTPKWKADFLRKNAAFYEQHRRFIDRWMDKWEFHSEKFPPSRRKFEWQAQDTPDLWSTVMQMRPTGIRAKKPTYLPALVAITQTSIIGPKRRRLSTSEAARLQSLPSWFDFGDQSDAATYKQLGNGVSVAAIWHVVRATGLTHEETLRETCLPLAEAILTAPLNPTELLEQLALRDRSSTSV